MLFGAQKALAYLLSCACLAHAFLALPAAAETVALIEGLPELRFAVNGQTFTIARTADPQAVITGEFARTSRACPPFCMQPVQAAPGVPTLGEVELLAFLRDKVATGEGVLLDARLPDWFAKGSIPSAVNVPFATLAPENPFRYDILQALGARPAGGGKLDFSAVPELVVFCNGAWSDQSPRALTALIEAGYPVEKLRYYRGGMQDWLMLGLTVAMAERQE
ncbi:MAG: rhodanese-like domain-containing protein [Gemmobacter sp.]|nr:rhodanese-like domain-containing protein [Gemmobacter sp.]